MHASGEHAARWIRFICLSWESKEAHWHRQPMRQCGAQCNSKDRGVGVPRCTSNRLRLDHLVDASQAKVPRHAACGIVVREAGAVWWTAASSSSSSSSRLGAKLVRKSSTAKLLPPPAERVPTVQIYAKTCHSATQTLQRHSGSQGRPPHCGAPCLRASQAPARSGRKAQPDSLSEQSSHHICSRRGGHAL